MELRVAKRQEYLIQHSHVSSSVRVVKAHESQDSQPVLDLHQDNIVLQEFPGSVGDEGALVETPAMDEEHHRKAAAVSRSLKIELQCFLLKFLVTWGSQLFHISVNG